MVEQATMDNFTAERFWDACKYYDVTLCIIRTGTGRIIGCYSPMKWQNSGGPLSAVEVMFGNTFALFFDDLKLRICKTKKGLKSWV